MTIAIIGTAGRDKTRPMSKALWDWMLSDAMLRVPKASHLVSGGAAWADHLAVALFLNGDVAKLTLHLPAPLGTVFEGPYRSAASAANFYHKQFSAVIGKDTIREVRLATQMDRCDGSFEPASHGFNAMFARNAKVAMADEMIAYTWGPGDVPADGGTLDTWNKCKGKKTHVSLLNFK